MPIPRWDDHAWHIEALAERHARGNAVRKHGPMPSNNSNRGGQRRSGPQRSQGRNSR